MRAIFFILGIATMLYSCDFIKNTTGDRTTNPTDSLASGEKKKFSGTKENRYENGKLSASIEYLDGVRHGMAREYYENGKLKLEMLYEHGKRQGRAVTYDEKGYIVRESFYLNDELDGIRKIYSKGKIRAEIPYKMDKPGKGLVEYLLDGKLKTKYPSIMITPVDDRTQTGYYHLQIEFTEVNHKDEFYLGDLLNGKYVHTNLELINTRSGHGKFSVFVPPGNFIMKELHIIGVHYTAMGNPYVATRVYNLSIE